MNDFQRLIEFLTLGGYKENDDDSAKRYTVNKVPGKHKDFEYETTINLDSGIGYAGFVCEFFFDKEGKLIIHGCWE